MNVFLKRKIMVFPSLPSLKTSAKFQMMGRFTEAGDLIFISVSLF